MHTAQAEEPRLTVSRPTPSRRSWSRLRRPVPLALFLVPSICFVLVLANGHATLPFQRIVTIEAKMASKSDYFENPEVKKLLLQHGFKVHITRMGSRGIATQDYSKYDIVFPSGQPAGDLITSEQAKVGRPARPHWPFTSPIVLGTYREYAETLRARGVAEPQTGTGKPLYYTLDMRKFLDLSKGDAAHKTGYRWDDIDIGVHGGISNGNRILAQTSDICQSNSGGTYLGLVSFVENGNDIPEDKAEALAVAKKIKRLLRGQGLPASEKNETYVSAEGKSISPIAVIYEHQFLAHQIRHKAEQGTVDDERVLLYPSTRFVTEPQLIAFTDDGDRLGRLISEDAEFQRLAMETGFRVRDADSASNSDRLTRYLKDRGIQAPVASKDDTKAVLPDLNLLEYMIEYVGNCPKTQPEIAQAKP